MSSNDDVWILFRGQLVRDDSPGSEPPPEVSDLNQIVEVIKAEKISKSYVKLKETPVFHPNVSVGDIMKVQPSEQKFSNNIAVIEFSGVELEEESDAEEQEQVKGIGTGMLGFTTEFLMNMISLDKKVKPIVNDKFEQGLVFEPVQMISHGSYKINIAFNAENESDFKDMRDHFENWKVFFHRSANKSFGSVAFFLDTKFAKAVECLESAPCVSGCYIAFTPAEFPQIEFSPDLIPGNEDKEENNGD